MKENKQAFMSEEDSKIVVLTSETELKKIQDSINNNDPSNIDNNYVLIPTKLPFKIFVALLIQIATLLIGGTAFYINVNTSLQAQSKKIERIENTVVTRSEAEAKIRFEIQNLEHKILSTRYDDLKDTIRKENEVNK